MDTGGVNPDGFAAIEAPDLVHQQVHPVALVIKKPDNEVAAPVMLHVEGCQPTGKREGTGNLWTIPCEAQRAGLSRY